MPETQHDDVMQRLAGFLSTANTAPRRDRLKRSIGFVVSLTFNAGIEHLDARSYKAIQLGVLGFVGKTKGNNSRPALSRGNNSERRLGSALAHLSNKMKTRAAAVPLYYYCC